MQGIQFHDLPDAGVLRFSGADAVGFLEGQLTADIASLAAGDSTLAAWCTPQGRVIALPRILRTGDELVAVLPRELAATVAERLRRFVMRARVVVENASEQIAAGGLSGLGPDTGAGVSLAAGPTLLPLAGSRALLVGPRDALQAAGRAWPAAPAGDWRALAVALGEPEVYAETSEAWIPQMLNLDLLGAVSFSKGCYPGQEIVARTQNLGRIKRRLFRYRLAGEALPAAGAALYDGTDKVGEIVRAARDVSGPHLLAVVALDRHGLTLGTQPGLADCSPVPLPYAVPEAAAPR